MNEKFFDLPRVKQDKMINGAIEVFAKNGYKHASTDDMVKVVGVSKGLWFHYFGSKLGIYTFVYEYCVKYVFMELSAVVDDNEKNFFEVMKRIELAKVRAGKSYPYIVMFLENVLNETNEEIVSKTKELGEILYSKISSLMKNSEIEWIEDKTKHDIIKNMVKYSIKGLRNEKLLMGIETDVIYQEIKSFIDMFEQMSKNVVGEIKQESMTFSVL